MEPGADLETEPFQPIPDGSGGTDAAAGPVEGCEEAVSGRVELAALEARQLAADDRGDAEPGGPANPYRRSWTRAPVEPTMSVKSMVASRRRAGAAGEA